MSSSYPNSFASVGSSSGSSSSSSSSSSSRARRSSQFPPKPKSVRFWKVLGGQELDELEVAVQAPVPPLHESGSHSLIKPRFMSVLGWALFLGAILGLGVLVSGVSLQEFLSPVRPVNVPE